MATTTQGWVSPRHQNNWGLHVGWSESWQSSKCVKVSFNALKLQTINTLWRLRSTPLHIMYIPWVFGRSVYGWSWAVKYNKLHLLAVSWRTHHIKKCKQLHNRRIAQVPEVESCVEETEELTIDQFLGLNEWHVYGWLPFSKSRPKTNKGGILLSSHAMSPYSSSGLLVCIILANLLRMLSWNVRFWRELYGVSKLDIDISSHLFASETLLHVLE